MNVLCLSPHTDDVELAAGGTVKRLAAEGNSVRNLVFSPCYTSIPEDFPRDATRDECRDAMNVLGVSDVVILDYAVRHFPTHRQGILEMLMAQREAFDPDLVIMPSLADLHQDHQAVATEGLRAFRDRRILGYECPRNMAVGFTGCCFVNLKQDWLRAKLDAAACYVSQRRRSPGADDLEALARVRGRQAGVTYAESFEVIRWMI